MNRYKKGFFKLKQEWNGELVEYKDVEPLEQSIKLLRNHNSKLELQIDTLNEEYSLLELHYLKLNKWFGVSIFIIVLLITIIISLIQKVW